MVDKYICPFIRTCKNTKCEHGEPHIHNVRCYGSQCPDIWPKYPNAKLKHLVELLPKSLVCINVKE